MAEEVIYLVGEGGGRARPHKLPLPDAVAQRVEKGVIRRVNEDGSPWVPEEAPTRPADSALKPAWVGWAIHNGADPEDAEAATKHDLIEKYG